ncbi:MAG: hypothetical protein AAFY82_10325 [Pseudomonadota bacterium]
MDRYAQTARDALSALDGLVPESQQIGLEARYSAMLILKWSWNGGASVTADPSAVAHLAACIAAGPCETTPSDQFSLNASALPAAPSPELLYWAQSELACDLPVPEGLIIAADAPEAEPDLALAQPETLEVAAAPSLREPDAEIPASTDDIETGDTEDDTQPEPVERAADNRIAATDEADPALAEASDAAPQAPLIADAGRSDAANALAALNQSLRANAMTLTDTVPTDADPAALVQSAARLFAAGRPAAAILPLRTACFAEVEAQTERQSQACNTLLDVYNAPTERNGAANTPSYLALSEELCAIGYNRGCQNLARHYAGQNTAEAHLATVAFTELSCSLGDGEACAAVSDYYLAGRATEPDPDLARQKLEQACALGRLSSCQDVADYHLRGVGGAVSVEKALTLNEASCPAENAIRPDICVAAADFVMIHMQAGPQRSAKVRAFTQRACALGHDIGCAWYAEDLELGIGGEVNLLAAKDARLVACEYGHKASCDTRS